MNSRNTVRSLILWLGCMLATAGRADFPPLALKAVSLQQIVSPTDIANAGDGSGRLFVADQAGIVYILRDGMVLPQPFLDVRAKLVPKAPTTYPFPLSTSYEDCWASHFIPTSTSVMGWVSHSRALASSTSFTAPHPRTRRAAAAR